MEHFNLKKSYKYIVSFIVGTGILSFGLYNIHSRVGISEGGVLGLSLLIYNWFGISPGLSSLVLDFTAFGIGTLVCGKKFLLRSMFASTTYALWYFLFEYMGPVLPDFSGRPLISAVLGGILVGTGCGLVVRYDCAAGGDDALAIVANKLFGVRVSCFYVVSDFIVLMLSLTYIPLRRIVWSMLSVLISSGIIELLRMGTKEANEE